MEAIKNFISYNPDTGKFVWIKPTSTKIKYGDNAGYTDNEGYSLVKVKGKIYSLHRIAWFLYYGYEPKNQIDHINGIKSDNRICNLRECTNSQNQKNTKIKKNNTSGYKGVYFVDKDRWRAICANNGVRKHLGYYKTAKEASIAYNNYAKKVHAEFYCCTV